jgi:hypothetical protein
MNSVLLHLLILWVVIAGTLGAIFVATRAGVTFKGLRPTDIFAFVGATFGVIIGLTTFFASEHYSDLEATAQHEATSLGDVVALSGSFPLVEGARLRGQLLCYATDVIDDEWSKTDGIGSRSVDDRQSAAYALLLRIGRQDPEPEIWYSNALRASLDTADQRQQRVLLSQPQIPVLLWFLLYVGAALIVLFVCFFHLDRRAHLAGMIVAVVLVLSAVFGVLAGLDTPTEGPLGLDPEAMDAEQTLISQSVDTGGQSPKAFCEGLPVATSASQSLRQ